MRPSINLLKASSSSTRWLARQARDPHVKARNTNTADQPTFRSRSSFKLLSINSNYPFLLDPARDFERDKIVVDLGAAPGGWSQVAAHKMGGRGRVFALDILEMTPIPGVHTIQGDFLSAEVQAELRRAVGEFRPSQFGLAGGYEPQEQLEDRGVVDFVMSDMMAPMSGVRLTDVRNSLDLVQAATSFAFATLKQGEGDATWLHKGRERFPGGHFL